MENEEKEIIDSENDTDITVNEDEIADVNVDTTETSISDSDIEELKKQIETLKHQKEHWKQKANEIKTSKPETKVLSKQELSPLDIISLSRNNIHEDDIKDILEYAKFKNITVSEALKSSIIKSTIAEKEEFRQSAGASNTGGSRRGSSKTTTSQLLENARKGIFPDNAEDIAKLAKARK